MPRLRLLTRISMFAALFYLFSFLFAFIPNINPGFFVVFAAGFLWGAGAGMAVGAIGMGLWTTYNPFGPAGLPVALAQIIGMSLVGFVGYLSARGNWEKRSHIANSSILILAGIAGTVLFFIPVNLVDAWTYQPFFPRLIAGFVASVHAVIFNAALFPLLFVIVRRLHEREEVYQ